MTLTPIFDELRRVTAEWPNGSWTWACRCGDDALDFTFAIATGMGLDVYAAFIGGRDVDADVLSEALEAAWALQL